METTGLQSTSARTRSGNESANAVATSEPNELPRSTNFGGSGADECWSVSTLYQSGESAAGVCSGGVQNSSRRSERSGASGAKLRPLAPRPGRQTRVCSGSVTAPGTVNSRTVAPAISSSSQGSS